MTWWEVEQMAVYIADLEQAMDEWALSGIQMRQELRTMDALSGKIRKTLQQGRADRRKTYLVQLADRIEELRLQLTERLKRDLPDRR